MDNVVERELRARLPNLGHVFAPPPRPGQMLEIHKAICEGRFTAPSATWLIKNMDSIPVNPDAVLAEEWGRQTENFIGLRYHIKLVESYQNALAYKASVPQIRMDDLNTNQRLGDLERFWIPLLVDPRIPLAEQLGEMNIDDQHGPWKIRSVAPSLTHPYWTMVRPFGERKPDEADAAEQRAMQEGRYCRVFLGMLELEHGLSVLEAVSLVLHFPTLLQADERILCAGSFYEMSGGSRVLPSIRRDKNGHLALLPQGQGKHLVYTRSFFNKS